MLEVNTKKRLMQLQKKAVLQRASNGKGSTWEAHLGGSCVPPVCRYCAEGIIRRTERPVPLPPSPEPVELNPLEAWV